MEEAELAAQPRGSSPETGFVCSRRIRQRLIDNKAELFPVGDLES